MLGPPSLVCPSIPAQAITYYFPARFLAAQKIPCLNYERRLTPSVGTTIGYFRSFVVGTTFTLGWTACVGPILAGILALAAVRAAAWQGASLLAAYSLRLGLPFLIMGAAFGSVLPLIRCINRYSRVIQIVSSLLLIIIGVLILTDKLGLISALWS